MDERYHYVGLERCIEVHESHPGPTTLNNRVTMYVDSKHELSNSDFQSYYNGNPQGAVLFL